MTHQCFVHCQKQSGGEACGAGLRAMLRARCSNRGMGLLMGMRSGMVPVVVRVQLLRVAAMRHAGRGVSRKGRRGRCLTGCGGVGILLLLLLLLLLTTTTTTTTTTTSSIQHGVHGALDNCAQRRIRQERIYHDRAGDGGVDPGRNEPRPRLQAGQVLRLLVYPPLRLRRSCPSGGCVSTQCVSARGRRTPDAEATSVRALSVWR